MRIVDEQEIAEFYSSADAARHAGVAYRSLMRWAEQGLIDAIRPEGRQKPPRLWSYRNVCEAYVVGELSAYGLSLETIGVIMLELRQREQSPYQVDHFLCLRKAAGTATVEVIGSGPSATDLIRTGHKVIGTVPPGFSAVDFRTVATTQPPLRPQAAVPHREFPWALHSAGVVELGGRLWVVGGRIARGHWDHVVYNTLVVFDPISGTWTQAASFPTARASVAVACVGGRIYAMGGDAHVGEFAQTYDCVDIYDPARNQWLPGPTLPCRLVAWGCVVFGECIWLMGQTAGVGTERSLMLDTSSGQWRQGPVPPEPRSGGRAVVVGGMLWCVGGSGEEARDGKVLCYDPSAGWRIPTTLPDPCETTGVATDGRRIFVVGGLRTWFELRRRVDVYDTTTDTWSEAPPLPASGRLHHTCAVMGQYLYSVAGETDKYTSDNRVFRLDISGPPRRWVWEEVGA